MRLLLLFFLFLPITSTGSDPVAESSLAGEWEITVEIRNSEVYAVWIGRVWDYAEGDGEIIAQRRIDISDDCQSFGGPVFSESDVTFDGVDDYITCEIPDFVQIFAEMAPELAECRCFYSSPPYAAADVSPTFYTYATPIIYHPRLHLDVANATLTQGVTHLRLHFFNEITQSWESNPFDIVQRDGIQIWAGYEAARFASITDPEGWAKFLADSGFWDAIQPEHDDGFLMWESQADVIFSEEEMPDGFGLGPGTTVYIGRNPQLGLHYTGKMRAVAIDPGCRAH